MSPGTGMQALPLLLVSFVLPVYISGLTVLDLLLSSDSTHDLLHI